MNLTGTPHCEIIPARGYTLMTSEAQLRAIAKYDAENTIQIKMKLNIKKDADIIAQLEKMARLDPKKGKQGYIKELIRRDMGIE